jgi:hypothetical protein
MDGEAALGAQPEPSDLDDVHDPELESTWEAVHNADT